MPLLQWPLDPGDCRTLVVRWRGVSVRTPRSRKVPLCNRKLMMARYLRVFQSSAKTEKRPDS
jgi:hypothetical protein